jgi:biopolymer transport protein ExbB/TolQ
MPILRIDPSLSPDPGSGEDPLTRKIAVSRTTSLSQNILKMPLVWGSLACLGFFALFGKSTLGYPLVVRYCEGHPVEQVETYLFFIGLAALVIKFAEVLRQWKSVQTDLLEPVPAGGQSVADIPRLKSQIQRAAASIREGYLGRRLTAALEFVHRKSSSTALDDHLYYLADSDQLVMQGSYASVRIIIWAIPILGFLGTVIGITIAIASLSPEALEESLTEVTAGLGVAFDTTALALALSMVLMFAKYVTEKFESHLLTRVEDRVSRELVGRFDRADWSNDPDVTAVRRIADGVLAACDKLVERQSEVWRETIEAAHSRWATLTTAAGELLEAALSDAVASSLKQHAAEVNAAAAARAAELQSAVKASTGSLQAQVERTSATLSDCLDRVGTRMDATLSRLQTALTDSVSTHTRALTECEKEVAEENWRHFSEVQLALVETAAGAIEQQEQLVKQGEVLLRVVDATGQIKQLESTLNENLAALAGSQNFEQTVTSLAAAVQLLSSRLGHARHDRITLELSKDRPGDVSGEAA